MDRRDVLLLRPGRHRETELSCEQLYMRYVDAAADGTVVQLFEALARDLAGVSEVRLTDRSWLADARLRRTLDGVLVPFVRNGGRVR